MVGGREGAGGQVGKATGKKRGGEGLRRKNRNMKNNIKGKTFMVMLRDMQEQ